MVFSVFKDQDVNNTKEFSDMVKCFLIDTSKNKCDTFTCQIIANVEMSRHFATADEIENWIRKKRKQKGLICHDEQTCMICKDRQ